MMIPHIDTINGKKVLIVDDKPYYAIAGEVHNSASSSIESTIEVLDRCKELNLNTVLIPMTWQLIEPVEGKFEFDLLDGIIKEASNRGLHLGILWFGSWKNAQCSYCPAWIKQRPDIYKRAELVKGKPAFKRPSGILKLETTTISPFSKETRDKDARAFATMMEHIKEVDTNYTVISIQVENETGFLGSDFDNCEKAIELFNKPVPLELIDYLTKHQETLHPYLRKCLNNQNDSFNSFFKKMAKEVFIAYHTASYVEVVASAGKKVHPLPYVVNCWLNTKDSTKPGVYPCGGPVAKMIEIWQAAAPSIDVYCPDNYLTDFLGTCDDFVKGNNPLYIPESGLSTALAPREIYAIGHYNAMCFAPFGVEHVGDEKMTSLSRYAWLMGFAVDSKKRHAQNEQLYKKVNSLLVGAMPEIIKHYGTNDLVALIKERDKMSTKLVFGDYELTNLFLPLKHLKDNATLICRLSDDEFLLLVYGAMVSFNSLNKDKPYMQYLQIETGYYENGKWHVYKVLNGDEERVLAMSPELIKVKVNCYK